jgi:hypothetical protein
MKKGTDDATKAWMIGMQQNHGKINRRKEKTGTDKAINNDRTENQRDQQRKETKKGRKKREETNRERKPGKDRKKERGENVLS